MLLYFEEDPLALFSWKLFDEDVEMFVKGSWHITTSFATGMRINPDASITFPWGLPSFGLGFFFEQIPSLDLSVWFAQSFFLDIGLKAKSEDNTILAGYLGKENEFVQSVLLGNKGIYIPSYDFFYLPFQSKSSLGASAVFKTPLSTHELLLRFDSTKEEKKVFSGKRELLEKRLALDEYLRGRYFMLPDPEVEEPEVYLEDPNGPLKDDDNRRYRLATSNDVWIDAQAGFLILLIEHKGRILVFYKKDNKALGDESLGKNALPALTTEGFLDPDKEGTDFNWNVTWNSENMGSRKIKLNNKDCLLLYEPGIFSPFEMLSLYDLGAEAPADLTGVSIKLIYKGSSGTPYEALEPYIHFQTETGKSYFIVYRDNQRRPNFYNHYPFFDEQTHQLYGPKRTQIPPYLEYEILVQVETAAEGFVLPANTLPGSVRVKRNGVEETRFFYDEKTHTVIFETTIYPYDRIEIYYRTDVAEKNAGDILFVWGNRFSFSPWLGLELALGLRWNILPGRFTEESFEKTGAVVLGTSLKGGNDWFAYKVAASVSYSNPDTTGIRRLAGMEGNGLVIELSEDLAVPAATSKNITFLGQRGKLFYKDYRRYDSLGGYELMPADWTPPPDQIFSYSNGSKIGPYLVAESSSTRANKTLMLDFELEQDQWVGFQLPFNYQKGVIDLSALNSFIISMRALDLDAGESFEVYFELGAIGEDCDGDNILDKEATSYDSGFIFNDTANGVYLLVGGGPKNEGNGFVNSEDIDGNGFLDTEQESLVYTSAPKTINTNTTGWFNFEDSFTVFDKEKLKKVRALRVIVKNTATGQTKARLQIGSIRLLGCSFWAELKEQTTGTVSLREIGEGLAGIPLLASNYPEVRDIFHSNIYEQKVLQINWEGISETNPGWVVKTIFSSGTDLLHYQYFNFYLYLITEGSSLINSLIFKLLDLNNKGLKVSIVSSEITTSSWHKISVDLFNKSVFIDGKKISGANISFDNDATDPIFFSLETDASGKGNLFLDEIHLAGPKAELGLQVKSGINIKTKGAIIKFGDLPLISNLLFNEELTYTTRGFANLYSPALEASSIRSNSSLKIELIGMAFSVNFTAISLNEEWSFAGSHALQIPARDFPLSLKDSFAQYNRGPGISIERGNSLSLNIPSIIMLLLSQSANNQAEVLNQSWLFDLKLLCLAPYKIILQANFKQSSLSFQTDSSFYFENWIAGYQLLWLWQEGPVLNRSFNLVFNQSLESTPVGISLAFVSCFNSFAFQEASRRQNDNLALELKLPISLGNLSLESIYQRKLYLESLPAEGIDPGIDFESHFVKYIKESFFFTNLPFFEIFSQQSQNLITSRIPEFHKINYQSLFQVNLSRKFGQELIDFILPAKIGLGISRSLTGQATGVEDLLNVEVSFLFNSLNIFGQRSNLKIFNWYDLDSFATNIKVMFSWIDLESLIKFIFSTESIYSIEIENKNKLSIRNCLLVNKKENTDPEINDKAALELSWIVKPEKAFSLPLIDEKLTASGYYQHKETIEFEYISNQITTNRLLVQFKHETMLKYPELGYLRGEIAIGMDNLNYLISEKSQSYYTIGLKLTIELSLNF